MIWSNNKKGTLILDTITTFSNRVTLKPRNFFANTTTEVTLKTRLLWLMFITTKNFLRVDFLVFQTNRKISNYRDLFPIIRGFDYIRNNYNNTFIQFGIILQTTAERKSTKAHYRTAIWSVFFPRIHTEKSIRNLIKLTRNQIVFIIFRLIWSQTDVRLVPNQSENSKFNLISKRFLCV